MPIYSHVSKKNLDSCHPYLRLVFTEVLRDVDHSIICGHRGEAEQNQAYMDGNSQLEWPESKHNKFKSLAVDAAPYPIDWDDKERFCYFGGFVLGVASRLGIELVWGGAWKTFKDYPHFELKEV